MRLTPTEQRILDLLADAQSHTYDEILHLLDDGEYNGRTSVKTHISTLRSKIVGNALTVVCFKGKPGEMPRYQLAQFLPGPLLYIPSC